MKKTVQSILDLRFCQYQEDTDPPPQRPPTTTPTNPHPTTQHGPTRHLEGFIHVDDISPLSPTEGLFSANLYLAMPRAGCGGELLIYDVEVNSRWDFYRHAPTLAHLTAPGEEGQEVLRAKLPPPRVIRPGPGDLVVLCAQRPHAVQGFPLGTRVSIQAFLTYKAGEPLRMDN